MTVEDSFKPEVALSLDWNLCKDFVFALRSRQHNIKSFCPPARTTYNSLTINVSTMFTSSVFVVCFWKAYISSQNTHALLSTGGMCIPFLAISGLEDEDDLAAWV